MKVNWKVIFGAVLVLGVAIPSVRAFLNARYIGSPRSVLEHSDKFTLYSLTPAVTDERPIVGRFHLWGILGQTQITDPKLRAKLVNALYSGLGPGESKGCLNPTYGLRATRQGRTVDVALCFGCEVAWFSENGKSTRRPLSLEPMKVFEQAVVGARLPKY